MKIIKKEIELCVECNSYKGFVKEEYNDYVPVYCKCDLEAEREKGGWMSPCMVCPNGDKFHWTPISYYKNEAGEFISVPYFSGLLIDRGDCKKGYEKGSGTFNSH